MKEYMDSTFHFHYWALSGRRRRRMERREADVMIPWALTSLSDQTRPEESFSYFFSWPGLQITRI